MRKQRKIIFGGIAAVLLTAIILTAWYVLGGINKTGEQTTQVEAPPSLPMPTVMATPLPPDAGVAGTGADPTATAVSVIIGDLDEAAGGLNLDIPPSLDELVEKYPELGDLLLNLDLSDEEWMRQVYGDLLMLYENEGIEGLHEFMVAAGILDALNLDSVYIDFVLAYEYGGVVQAKELARERGLLTNNDEVRAILILDTEDVALVEPDVIALGAIVLDHYGNEMEIGIPMSLIESYASSEEALTQLVQIAHLPHVIGVKAPNMHVSDQTGIQGEGPEITQSNDWHVAGYSGDGIKIGIIDPDGFYGFLSMLGNELPSAEHIFIPDWQDAEELDQYTGEHGTACAEIVHEMAPGADIYLAHVDWSMNRVVDWMLANGVDIISYSAGSIVESPDGAGQSVREAQRAIDQGVLWVNSSGNYAQSHLYMPFTDDNDDGWHEFPHGNDLLRIYPTDTMLHAGLSWDDVWGGAGENYDLYIFREPVGGGDLEIFASARSLQRGRSADEPYESLRVSVSSGYKYYLAVKAQDITRPGQLNLLGYHMDFERSMPERSLASPSDGSDVLAVGATFWRDDDLEEYSSQGPTLDGRTKPDIVAPARVSNVSYQVFAGTSASAPHVAGAAALVMEAFPDITAVDTRDYLLQYAFDVNGGGPDNEYGVGRLNLPPPPSPSDPPQQPSTGEATAVIRNTQSEHNVYLGGVKGMNIYVDFDIDNHQERGGKLLVHFFDDDTGDSLRDGNGRYADQNDNVVVYADFTPQYDSSRYTNVDLFMPYDEFELGAGEHQLHFIVFVLDAGNDALTSGEAVRFSITKQGETRPQAQFNDITVDHHVTRNGVLGMDIHLDFDIVNYRGKMGETAVYFYFDGSDNRPLLDFNDEYNTDSGNAAVGQQFTPGQNSANYDDFALFMPYDELHMAPGGYYELKLYAIIWGEEDGVWKELDTSDWIPFWMDTR